MGLFIPRWVINNCNCYPNNMFEYLYFIFSCLCTFSSSSSSSSSTCYESSCTGKLINITICYMMICRKGHVHDNYYKCADIMLNCYTLNRNEHILIWLLRAAVKPWKEFPTVLSNTLQ